MSVLLMTTKNPVRKLVFGTTTFNSSQTGGSASNGYVLQTNGTNSTWVATSTLGITSATAQVPDWNKQSTFNTFALTPTTTIPVWVKDWLYASSSAIVAGSLTATTYSGTSTTASSSINYLTTINQLLTGNLTVQGTGTSTFQNGIDVKTGCFAVNGICVTGGGSTPTATLTTTIDLTCNASKATSTEFAVGGSFYTPTLFTNSDTFTGGSWDFGAATSSEVDCIASLPTNLSATPNFSTFFTWSATSTTKIAVIDVDATTTIPQGGLYNPTQYTNIYASTSAGDRISTQGTAGIGTTSIRSFSLTGAAGDTDILVRIRRFGLDAADTASDLFLVGKPRLKMDIKVN